MVIKPRGCCRRRGECLVHQGGGGSKNNANSQLASSEEGLGGNENKRHYALELLMRILPDI